MVRWNTPIGGAVKRGNTHDGLATTHNAQVGQLNRATYCTPVDLTDSSGLPLTIHEVAAGRWSPAIGSTTVPRAPSSGQLSGDMTVSAITYNEGGG